MPDEIRLTKPIPLTQVQGQDQAVETGVSINLEPIQLSSPISIQSLSPSQFSETPTTPPEIDEGSVASLERSLGNIYSGFGGMFHWMDQVGVNISRAIGTPEEDINKVRDYVPWKPIAEYFNKKAEQKFAEAEPPKDLGPIKNIWDILDPERAMRMLVEQGPQSALMMASMLLNPTLGTLYMSGVGAGSIQNAADEIERKTGKQLNPIHKVVATSLGGAFESALEKIGFESAFKTAGAMPLKQRLLKAVVGVATEAGTEGLQEVNQMLAEASFTGEVPEGAAKRLVDSTYGGLVLGFGANLVTGTFGSVGESEAVKHLPEPTKVDLYRQAIEQNNTPEALRLEQELTNERLAHPVIQEDGSIKWEELSNEELEGIISPTTENGQQFLDWARTQIDQHELLKDYIEQGRVPGNHLPTQNPGGEIQEDILGKETDDGIPAVRYNPPKFIKWLQQRITFPEFLLFKAGKELARKTSSKFIMAEQELQHIIRDYETWYKKLSHGLSKEELQYTREAMELAYQSHDPSAQLTTRMNAEQKLSELFAKYPKIAKTILGVDNRGGLIQLFEFVKKRYQNMLVERKKIEYGDQYDTINTLIEQERVPGLKPVMTERAATIIREKFDVETIAKDKFNKSNKDKSWDDLTDKMKEKQIGYTVRGLVTKLTNAADSIIAIDKWGLRDYITNIELGSYRIFDENGNTVGFAKTAKEAKRRAFELRDKLRAEGKPVPKYEIEATFSPIKPTVHRGHWAIVDSEGNVIKEVDPQLVPKKEFAKFKKELKEQGKSVLGYSLERVDVLKGMDNIFEVLPRYIYAMEKRIIYEPLVDQFKLDKKSNPGEYTPDVNAIIQNQIDYITGAKYSRGNMIVDQYAQKLGWETGLYSKIISKIRKYSAYALLGYRPIAAGINALAGFGNTWVAVGNQFFAKASEAIKTGKYVDQRGYEVDINRILRDIEDKGHLAIDFAVNAEGEVDSRVPLWHPLGMFSLPEKHIRPHSFVANYIYQIEHLGKDHFEAQEAALMNLRFQQAAYNIAAIPQMLRAPSGKLIGQFKSYMISQLQFMSTLRGKQIPRMIGLQLAMAGPRGAVYMLKSLPVLGALGLLDDLEKWLVKKEKSPVQGFLKRGVGGLIGGDISAPATFQLPNKPEDWAGPFLSKAYKLFKDVLFPGLQSVVGEITGHPHPAYVTDEGIDWVNSLSPMMTYVDDLLESVLSWESDVEVDGLQDGYKFLADKLQRPNIWIRDSQGNKAYQVGGLQDRILLALGIQPVSKSQYSTIKRIWERNAKISGENRRKWFTRVSKRLIDGKPLDADLIQDGILYQVDMSQIPDSYSFKQMTPQQRETMRARLFDKAEAFDTFNLK